MSAVLTSRSATIRGRMVAITVRSSAPTKTASSAAPSARRSPLVTAASTSTPLAGAASAADRGRVGLDRRLNRDLLAVVGEVQGPGRRVVAPLAGWLGQPRPQQVVGLAVDPEIDRHRRA